MDSEQLASGALEQIVDLLGTRRGVDFSSFKVSTVRARVAHRMALNGITRIDAYARHLACDPREVAALSGDLLIGITSFFRDAEAFTALAAALREYPSAGRPLRIWVPGCATGEEAYSIGIVVGECGHTDARIFATDVDAIAIERARMGMFRDIEEAVTGPRLVHFRPNGSFFEVRAPLRDQIVFATHDVFADPPFSQLDLVSCRNVLLHFEPAEQERLLRTFHYALAPGGLLFLGSAESIGPLDDLFEVVDTRWRIYRRRPEMPASIPTLRGRRHRRRAVGADANACVAELAPPLAIVDGEGTIVYLHGLVGAFLDLVPGTTDVHAAAQSPLAQPLRDALARVTSTHEQVVVPGVIVDDEIAIDLRVQRVKQPPFDGLYAVVFERARTMHPTMRSERPQVREDRRLLVDGLLAENERLRAMNETLLATNEEIEAAKEELVAANAELTVMSQELAGRLHREQQARDDLAAVLEILARGVVFLDRDLHIRDYSEDARRMWNLDEHVRGLAIATIATTEVVDALRAVLRTLEPTQITIARQDAPPLRMDVAPYRTPDHVIDGLVLMAALPREAPRWREGEQCRSHDH